MPSVRTRSIPKSKTPRHFLAAQFSANSKQKLGLPSCPPGAAAHSLAAKQSAQAPSSGWDFHPKGMLPAGAPQKPSHCEKLSGPCSHPSWVKNTIKWAKRSITWASAGFLLLLSPKKGKKKSPGVCFYLQRSQRSVSCKGLLGGRIVSLIVSLLRSRLPSAFKLELVTLGLTLHYFEAQQH